MHGRKANQHAIANIHKILSKSTRPIKNHDRQGAEHVLLIARVHQHQCIHILVVKKLSLVQWAIACAVLILLIAHAPYFTVSSRVFL